MEDRDPIKLQHLLDDPGKVLEKISRIRPALDSIHPRTASAEAPSVTSVPSRAGASALSEADSYNALLQTLRKMQLQIEECLRPLAVQAVQAEAERLNEWMSHEQQALNECLAQIDQSLLACVELIHESQKQHSHLSALKQRLEELDASPSSLPEFPTSQDPSEFIVDRAESLRRQGKI